MLFPQLSNSRSPPAEPGAYPGWLSLWWQKIGAFNGTDCLIVTCGASEDRVSMLLTETRSNPLQEDTASEEAVLARFHKLPGLRFEDQKLTFFGGVIVFQVLFQRLHLKAPTEAVLPTGEGLRHLWSASHCVAAHRASSTELPTAAGRGLLPRRSSGAASVGLTSPARCVATICRTLAAMGRHSVDKVRQLSMPKLAAVTAAELPSAITGARLAETLQHNSRGARGWISVPGTLP